MSIDQLAQVGCCRRPRKRSARAGQELTKPRARRRTPRQLQIHRDFRRPSGPCPPPRAPGPWLPNLAKRDGIGFHREVDLGIAIGRAGSSTIGSSRCGRNSPYPAPSPCCQPSSSPIYSSSCLPNSSTSVSSRYWVGKPKVSPTRYNGRGVRYDSTHFQRAFHSRRSER